MTEFRRDPLTHRWIVTGYALSDNPEELVPTLRKPPETCPFCEGKEYLTPPENYAIRKNANPNGPGWDIRVVPNRATDLRIVELQKRAQGGVYDLQNGSGIHETIIETSQHVTRFSQLEIPQMANVLRAYQQRNGEHKKNHLLKGTLIFRNQGKGSAVIYEHTHSQIISLPFVPRMIHDELVGAKRYYDLKTRCIFCDMAAEEIKINQRVIFEKGNYLAWCPFAARFPFEVWVISRQHHSEFLNADSNSFDDLAVVLKTVLSKIEKIMGDAPISFILHTAPLRFDELEEHQSATDAYHWHIEILPHALPAGGFEWGGDFFLSPPTPENCAKVLIQTQI